MKFFQDERERLVWDADKGRVVADFAELGGVFNTEDKLLQDKLICLGYRADGVQPNTKQKTVLEEAKQKAAENDPKPRTTTAFPPPGETAAAGAAREGKPKPAPARSTRQR